MSAYGQKWNIQILNSIEIAAKSSIIVIRYQPLFLRQVIRKSLLARGKYPPDTIVLSVALFR